MEQLISLLSSIYPMSADLATHLNSIVQYKEISRKEYLLRKGMICRHIYFVEAGLLRCFYERNGTEVCSWFMKEGDFIYAVNSFLTQQPSYESIQALENCRLYYISYQDIQYIYQTFLEFNVHRGVLTEHYYQLSEERLFSMRQHSAKERYDYLLKHHPDVIQRIPLRYISSYIGISLASLKRIRSQSLNKSRPGILQ